MSTCSFNVCSLITDVRESVSELPRDPDEVKSLLMEHLGIGGAKGGGAAATATTATSDSAASCATPNTVFKHPISYSDPAKLHELSSTIIEDLEMIHPKMESVDTDAVKGLYHYVFSPTSVYGTDYLPIWSKYYTTDISYLKNTQTLLEMFDNELLDRNIAQNTGHADRVEAFSTMKDTWTSFRGNGKIADFKEKFSYIETPFLSKLNTSSSFLQFLSLYNISSPVIALLTPIIVLIIPFFVLIMRGLTVSVGEYIDILKTIIGQHSIGRIFNNFSEVSFEQKIYILMSVIFYIIQIYQNVMACIRFYNNIKLVHTHLHTINGYLTVTGVNMSYMIQLIQTYHLSAYESFREELSERYTLLNDVTHALTDISPFSVSVSKFFQIGFVMKNYYSLFSQTDLNELLEYSFGFNAYMEHLTACRSIVLSGMLNKCSFVATTTDADAGADTGVDTGVVSDVTQPLRSIAEAPEGSEGSERSEEPEAPDAPVLPPPPIVIKRTGITKLAGQIYAPLKARETRDDDDNDETGDASHPTTASTTVVANDVSLDKQLIITGPNAAGKTTVIKTTLFNLILSQQIGYGFYDRAEINPYDFLHCYLNIPDTSGRDSLFQAESRRCMEILRCIMDNPMKRHFCIFDELYSGTNPYEAVAAAYGYIDYISKNPRVDLILTTHYIELCELLEKRNAGAITNLHMSVSPDTGAYLYKIASGISSIKGGLKVLRDLEYPTEIVECAREIIEKK
jgi:hypothetical protein